MPTETTILKTLEEFRIDLKHIRKDVDVLKGLFLEDSFLTKEERKHIDETMRFVKTGKKDEFIRLI